MAGSIRRIGADSAPNRVHKRAAARRQLSDKAIAFYVSGERKLFELNDISTFGCRIVCEGAELTSGEFLHVADAKAGPIPAIVRWVKDGLAGLEFTRFVSENELAELSG